MPATALVAPGEVDAPRADGYARRRPEESLLYQVVEEHWPEFRQRAEEAGGLPLFVAREFDSYLKCGILEHGLARLACRRCGHEMVLAWSCKKRGWCPSCCGRRMADAGAHLVDDVLPESASYRQWVCSLPFSVRAAVAFDRDLCADVLEAFTGSLLRHVRWRVKRAFGLQSVAEAHVGAITFIQRCDGALRVDPHFHTLAADGAWVVGQDGALQFRALPDPSPEDLATLAIWTHARLMRVLEEHGRLVESADTEMAEQPVLASCYGASAGDMQLLGLEPGRRIRRAIGAAPSPVTAPSASVAEAGGVNIHAGRAIDGRDRRARSVGRPLCERSDRRPGAALPLHGQAAPVHGTA
jgi:hypothetical protein